MIPKLYIVDDEPPARVRLKTLLTDIEKDCPHKLAGESGQAQTALEEIAACAPDIVLLDVQMPGMTGIELATRLTALPNAPEIIFVSAYDEYALKAFDVHALDYLLKPVRASRLAEAIRRVAALRAQRASQASTADEYDGVLQQKRRHFSIQERGRVLLVPVAEVIYLKAELKYVTVRTAEREYLLEESLMSIEEELNNVFIRVHRNALVAKEAILGVEKGALQFESEGDAEKTQDAWQVILRGVEERLPISRRQWPLVKALVR